MSSSDSRGKRIIPSDPDEVPPSQNNKEPSLPSRIASSASSLTRDLISNGGPSSAASVLSSNLENSEKSSASASRATSTAGDLPHVAPYRGKLDTAVPSSSKSRGGLSPSRFRSIIYSESAIIGWRESELDEYTANGTNGAIRQQALGEANPSKAAPWVGEYLRVEGDDLQYYHSQYSNGNASKDKSRDVSAIEAQDGAEVWSILEDPNALVDDEPLTQDAENAEEEPTADEIFGVPLSSGEQLIKGKMLASLPPPPNHGQIDPHGHLNFRPNVELLHMPIKQSPSSTSLDISADTSVAYFSSHEQRLEWRRQWAEEWHDVLTSYQDEVWGVSLPEVQEVKDELEEMKQDEQKLHDSKAVRRLRQVLDHIKLPLDARRPIYMQDSK